MDLLTLLELQDDPAAADRVHVLMPCMAYYCGRTMLDPIPGRWVFPSDYDQVTCPDCLAPGREGISEECQRQQHRQAREEK